MPGPARGRTAYVSRHGLGYSAFEHSEEGIFTEIFTYVAPEAPLKFSRRHHPEPERAATAG